MMIYPTVSIIIPVYNTKRVYLEQCFDSILNQTYKDFEVIIVDSSTNSETISIIEKYLMQDSRFRLLNCGKGVSKQRNFGIDNSVGKYIAFVDSDDRISTDYFQKLVDALVKAESDIVFPKLIKEKYDNGVVVGTEALFYNPLRKRINKDCFFERTPENGLVNPIKLYRRELIGKNRFDEQLSYGEDMMFNYELSKNGFIAAYCENALYYFSADINVNSANKRLDKSSLNIVSKLYKLYKNEKKTTNSSNLVGILYQYNYTFEIFFRACVLNRRSKYLLWLLKYRLFYLSHNRLNNKQRFYILFPYLRIILKKVFGSKEE